MKKSIITIIALISFQAAFAQLPKKNYVLINVNLINGMIRGYISDLGARAVSIRGSWLQLKLE